MTPTLFPAPPRRPQSDDRAAAVEKLRRVYLSAGWPAGDSQLCSERDIRLGLYANVLGYRPRVEQT